MHFLHIVFPVFNTRWAFWPFRWVNGTGARSVLDSSYGFERPRAAKSTRVWRTPFLFSGGESSNTSYYFLQRKYTNHPIIWNSSLHWACKRKDLAQDCWVEALDIFKALGRKDDDPYVKSLKEKIERARRRPIGRLFRGS